MISQTRLSQLQTMISNGTSDRFYSWPEWQHMRRQVLALDHYECQVCRKKHRYRRAVLVYHAQHLKDRPDLALSVFDEDTGKRQLISVCRSCHEELHPERMRRRAFASVPPVTEERWD